MSTKYETVITSNETELKIEGTLQKDRYEARITHYLSAKAGQELPYQEIRASALRATIAYAQKQLTAMGFEAP